jgi:lipopolysaccharide assembly outer membrane protein LptD (OstA)
MHLTAERLIIDEQNNTYRAEGKVVVNRSENYLYTEILVWDQIYDTIYTPDEVTLVRGGNTLKGYELRTDTEFRNISLNKVRAEGAVDEKNIGF